MTWYLQPGESTHPGFAGGGSSGDLGLPADVLERHGAAVLTPATAALLPGQQIEPTVYRTRTLLIPERTVTHGMLFRLTNEALAEIGLQLLPTAPPRPRDFNAVGGPVRYRPAVLAPRSDEKAPQPAVVDAWAALQQLRAFAARQEKEHEFRDAVSEMALEHLLVSSSINIAPAHGTNGHPAGLSSPAASYTSPSGDGRTPVAVPMAAPHRPPPAGRRPVVAVLDTGVAAHPSWLGVRHAPGGGYTFEPDSFVTVDSVIQKAIWAEGQAARAAGDSHRQLITDPWDAPVTTQPLVGELDTEIGHGTFIAGIVRQVAPGAEVLAVRVTHGDGVVYEGDLICALHELADRVSAAQAGTATMGQMVDVVSLSLGYFGEDGGSAGLWLAISELMNLGVLVVAAAGNAASTRPFFPAAFAPLVPPDADVPLLSVGALNPNGSKALFSNDGPWVNAWGSGASMVSTFPSDLNASLTPQRRLHAAQPAFGQVNHPVGVPGVPLPSSRAALDDDDFTAGFAIWSGTSFAAPLLAAVFAATLLHAASAGTGGGLEDPGKDAAIARCGQVMLEMR